MDDRTLFYKELIDMEGPMYKIINDKAKQFSFVNDYYMGKIDHDTFSQNINIYKELLISAGLDDWQIQLLNRFPSNDVEPATRMLKSLHNAGAISSSSCHEQAFQDFRTRVEEVFMHLPNRTTSIFPEEARIAFELSLAIRPKHVIVAGSYYNYFAVWLIPGLAMDGRMICIDIDPQVCELARSNMKALGYEDRVKVVCGDAEIFLQNDQESIDLFVVDAYGSSRHPDPRYHGKAIYGPLIKAALPHMQKDDYILAHNAEEGSKDLGEFFQAVSKSTFSMLLHTTDNAAVYRL
jgi:predicted O-methyltransferase YrrM